VEWLIILPLVLVAYLTRRKLTHLENRIEELKGGQDRLPQDDYTRWLESQLRDLTARIYQLERAGKAASAPPEPLPAPVPVVSYPAAPQPLPDLTPEPQPQEEPEPVPTWAQEQLPTEPPLLQPVFEPQEPLSEKLRHLVGDDEWEALVGGSLLNKLGALILVVGIILFLGYSFTQMGPLGRIAVSLAVSGSLLAGGFFIERLQRYRVFAWGLLGAGWASLYATTYAMYAVDAARVIDNQSLGVCLQLAVAAAMLGHSLRYQHQTVTGVAAASAFAALGLSPSKSLGVGGLLPLSGALLYLAQRLRWHGIGLFSLLASYGIIIARAEPGSPLAPAQATLFVLWLIFEAFDLIRLRDDQPSPAFSQAIFPLNALGFLVLSGLKWQAEAPQHLHRFLAAVALLYLADAIVRGLLRKDAYRIPIVLASGLAAMAIVREAGGAWAATLLGIEAELLFLAARRWRLKFLEYLAALVFVGALVRMLFASFEGSHVVLGGMRMHDWTPAALLLAILCYLNREFLTVPVPYGYFGSGLVQLVLGAEVPERWLALAWSAWAVIQLELSMWRKADDFRRQAYTAWLFGIAAMTWTHFDSLNRSPLPATWISLSAASVLGFHASWRLWRTQQALRISTVGALSASVYAMSVTWALLPDASVALAWMALALLLNEAGQWLEHPLFGSLSHAVSASVYCRLFFANFTNDGATLGISHRALTTLPVAASFVYLWRRCGETGWLRIYLWLASSTIVILMRFELGRVLTVTGWALFGLVLLLIGLRSRLADLRWQSYLLAAATALRCVATNFDAPESFGGLPSRLLTAAVVIMALYAQEFLLPRDPAATDPIWERYARSGYSLLGTALLSLLLYKEISGSLLTVAWGLQGLLLLASGFPARERVLRLSGLALLLGCILKLFFYDLRNLETLPRIFSFMVLGVILIGVSWVYTRFRERVRRLL